MKIGDSVKFLKVLSEDHRDWHMSIMKFNYVRTLIGKTGKILFVQKHYENDGSKTYYIDVEFPCGFKLEKANSVAFVLS